MVYDKLMVDFVVEYHEDFLAAQIRELHAFLDKTSLSLVVGDSPLFPVLDFSILSNFLSSHFRVLTSVNIKSFI